MRGPRRWSGRRKRSRRRRMRGRCSGRRRRGCGGGGRGGGWKGSRGRGRRGCIGGCGDALAEVVGGGGLSPPHISVYILCPNIIPKDRAVAPLYFFCIPKRAQIKDNALPLKIMILWRSFCARDFILLFISFETLPLLLNSESMTPVGHGGKKYPSTSRERNEESNHRSSERSENRRILVEYSFFNSSDHDDISSNLVLELPTTTFVEGSLSYI